MAQTTETTTHTHQRMFDIVKGPKRLLMPISGYQDMPLVSLEKAVEPLVTLLPDIQTNVEFAKLNCETTPADGLTVDESASIKLYTMESYPPEKRLYIVLNETLRKEDRRSLKPWLSYLRLILTALSRLPSSTRTVYRGVKGDLRNEYKTGERLIWWSFSSCTSSIAVLQDDQFLGTEGVRTMFAIECTTGKDISRHSYYQDELEILLIPARQFEVIGCLEPADNLHIIQLKEIFQKSIIAPLPSVDVPIPSITEQNPGKNE